MKDLTHYSLLSEMFRYPTENLKEYIPEMVALVRNYDPEAESDFRQFVDHVCSKPLSYQQEYYVNTFYVHPVCCLDTGYVLFGEDYRRGIYMANLKKEHNEAGNDCDTELPDHLPVVLCLLPRLKDPELAEELVCSLLITAVNEMIAAFGDKSNHYKNLLKILSSVMESDFRNSTFERFRIEKRYTGMKAQ
jgi:nitrate reductase molybdenum cofactor assembly chaperone